jgi:hypothetical protein
MQKNLKKLTKLIECFEMTQKKENMILMEVFEVEVLLDDLDDLEWM